MICFQQFEPVQYPLVNKFYSSQKLNRKANKSDLVFVAKKHSQVIACVLFKPISGLLWLTGLQVDSKFRKQGIAGELISQALTAVNKDVVTFPYQHLQTWYQRLGFEFVEVEGIPEPLAGRFSAYLNQGRELVVMQKSG